MYSKSPAMNRAFVGLFAFFILIIMSHLPYMALELSAAGDGPIPVVEVKLSEFAIEMPLTVPVGPLTFHVTNAGTVEHNFRVEGEGFERKFDPNLKPGETRDLQVELGAGTYTVSCPVDNHKDRRMRLELTVAQQRSE